MKILLFARLFGCKVVRRETSLAMTSDRFLGSLSYCTHRCCVHPAPYYNIAFVEDTPSRSGRREQLELLDQKFPNSTRGGRLKWLTGRRTWFIVGVAEILVINVNKFSTIYLYIRRVNDKSVMCWVHYETNLRQFDSLLSVIKQNKIKNHCSLLFSSVVVAKIINLSEAGRTVKSLGISVLGY